MDKNVLAIQTYLDGDQQLSSLYAKIKKHTSPFVSSTYDVTDKCNLHCEGCLFFSGSDYKSHQSYNPQAKGPTKESYADFFKKEALRGVNFAYFSGGEPALQQERIKIGLDYIKRGTVATNGTLKINEELDLSIHVSLWGDDKITQSVRGDSVFHQSINNFKNDKRATFIYTVNHKNISVIEDVTKIVHGHGSKISYNFFSPTVLYNHNLSNNVTNDEKYFRISTQDDNLALTADDRSKTHDILSLMKDKYQESVVYTKPFNDWVMRNKSLYKVDEVSGIAKDCPMNMSRFHRTYRSDLTLSEGKCCTPDIDCKECRAYAMSYGTFKYRVRDFLSSKSQFSDWVSVVDSWCRLYIVNWDELD